MAEPSITRTHKLAETSAAAAESVLSNKMLKSARLLCYHAGELLAAFRCSNDPILFGLDLRFCQRLLHEAEKLVLSVEISICELRLGRAALSTLFNWFKAFRATTHVDEGTTPTGAEVSKCRMKSHDWDTIGLLRILAVHSTKTDLFFGSVVSRLLSDPTPNTGDVSVNTKVIHAEDPTLEVTAKRISIALKNETDLSRAESELSPGEEGGSCEYDAHHDAWCNTQSSILSARLKGASMSVLNTSSHGSHVVYTLRLVKQSI